MKFIIKKRFKKIIVVIVLFLIVIFTSTGIFNLFNSNKSEIEKILKTESYSYLSSEAKDYVKNIYEETGVVVLTEKNKEKNKPYLNPEFINYLELGSKERESVSLIPNSYAFDYVITETYKNSTFPSKYDLRDVDGRNYISPIKDQGSTNTCWLFSTVQNVETLYMKNNNMSYSDLVPKFSIRQMDYITSVDTNDNGDPMSYLALTGNWNSGMCPLTPCKWTSWLNPDNANHELSKGGNFFASSIAMSNGITLVDESVMPWHEENQPVYLNEIYGYDKSLFEVDSAIILPGISLEDDITPELISSYVADVKKYIMEYGGPFVSTYSPDSTCGFENVDGKKVFKTDDCIRHPDTERTGHAMQIIGWDDDYEYSYCDAGTVHYSANSDDTCTNGDLIKGKGAWIIRNSWGTEIEKAKEYSYVYLTYDSINVSVGFTTSISDMKTRTWDNNYHSNPWVEKKISSGMVSIDSQTKEFNTHNNNPEKIEKIKFFAFSLNGKYNISIFTEDKDYDNIATVTSTELGIYTVNLSDKNILIDDLNFSVKIDSSNGGEIINDSISVFTSNVSDAPSIYTNYINGIKMYHDPNGKPSEENTAFISSAGDITIELDHYLKNVDDYKKISYKALLNGNDYSEYFFSDSNSTIVSNMIYVDGAVVSEFEVSEEEYSDVDVCGLEYTFQILYDNEVIDEFPLKRICKNWDGKSTDYTTSTIKFHKNDGSGIYTTVTKDDLNKYIFFKEDGSGNEYFGDEEKFFIIDKYLKSWNTEPDGSGTTYTTNELLLYDDLDLYAQWDSPHTYEYEYACFGDCESSSYGYHLVEYGEEIIIANNEFVNKNGDAFLYWTNIDDEVFYEEEKAVNVVGCKTPFNVDNLHSDSLEAVWASDYKTVTFDANGGEGTMKSINVATSTDSRLKYNSFIRQKHVFKGWNTKADGTGTPYTDGQTVNFSENITLYAQWEATKYKVTFNANNGSNETSEQNVVELTPTKLTKNSFTTKGHDFNGWNTEANGTGTSYTDEQEISISEDLVLYAQWKKQTYELTFDANGGEGTMEKQTFTYDESQNISDVKFTKEGHVFKEWNTKNDGTGTIYTNKQSIKIEEDTIIYAIWVEGPPYVINKYTVDEDNKIIDLIDVNTTVDEFKRNIELSNGYRIVVDSKTVNEKNVLYTGGKTKIYLNDSLIAEYTNVIRGDVDGNGTVSIIDYIRIMKDIMNSSKLSSVYKKAADVNQNEKIDIIDYIRIMKMIMEEN